ncbi:small acid-soluble spore protein O [Bacillus altitudinis]|uniref:small acid-soluble spore protein O n=1 Tax=Bacillus altitudinis TaxID=293387 RepID=UPI0021071186|nr:small acid-soluble spore protein O [Bacillus altitudinis]UTX10659.1 small acid-soluble spore protein O [Bacillus altitudinis]
MTKRKANHVIDGMNAAKSQGNGAGYIENDQLVLTEEQKQNNKKRKKTNKKGVRNDDGQKHWERHTSKLS